MKSIVPLAGLCLVFASGCRAVEPIELHWLADTPPAVEQGVTWVGRLTVPEPYSGPVALNPGEQMGWGPIYHMSQWSLNAIELLEFAGEQIPDNMPDDSAEE